MWIAGKWILDCFESKCSILWSWNDRSRAEWVSQQKYNAIKQRNESPFFSLHSENNRLYMDMLRNVRAQLDAHTGQQWLMWTKPLTDEVNGECWDCVTDLTDVGRTAANIFCTEFSQRLQLVSLQEGFLYSVHNGGIGEPL